MPKNNKLSIYLIKQEFAMDDNRILVDDKVLLSEISDIGNVYYNPSHSVQPTWIHTFFRDEISETKIFSANVRLVLICRITVEEDGEETIKTFAITMGYGKYLLDDDVIEEDFGLKVVLNTIASDSLRRIKKTNIGGNLKTSNEQLPLQSEINDFGFDIDRDLISTITGYSFDKAYVTGMMSGGDLLSLTAAVDVSNIIEFLKKTYKRYTETTYRTNFGWIDYIKSVKDSRLLNKLDAELFRLIKEESSNIWMAVPEIINWEEIQGFRYNGKEIYDDIDINIVKNSFRNGFNNIEQLKTGKYVVAISALDTSSKYKTWSAYKCLCGEFEFEGKCYCISGGRFFCIDRDFVTQVNNDYNSTKISKRKFIDYTDEHKSENDYSKKFVATNPKTMLCMDQQNIVHGGGKSKIELCDILTDDATYIHVKPYSGSATLSHLFNQAVVSAELILSDLEFCTKANLKIKENTDNPRFLIRENVKPNIILAIITKTSDELPPIPFFSKVALRYCKRRLEIAGCTVAIKNIKNTKKNKKYKGNDIE